MFLKKHRSIVLGQGGYFVGELNREYCAMVEAERFRLRFKNDAEADTTYRENAEKAISFARDMLESLGTELRCVLGQRFHEHGGNRRDEPRRDQRVVVLSVLAEVKCDHAVGDPLDRLRVLRRRIERSVAGDERVRDQLGDGRGLSGARLACDQKH